ncbi:DUF962 domain-containing protein [Sneathiella marina]|uniref:DUF962 domain-containing protein n=1 Tax=Sneathiella marina TaxID=2950108 RepID=A0ABY4W3L5_9PROT|nr:DUF962 domain-containing protein [Sneathiella marina]USG61785.1 DUF962 domain-containing protein [Sneathiella marina]
MQNRIQTYSEFWPYYLKEHSSALCRRLHFLGTTLALIGFAIFLITFNPILLLACAVGGYGPAWIAHFFVEKNRPATFTYPIWSLYSDFRMFFLWLSGRLPDELKKAGVP